MKKICLIVGLSSLGLGTIIFCIGAALGRKAAASFPIMWIGFSLIIFSILNLLFYVFYKAYLAGRNKNKDKNNDRIGFR